MLLFPRSAKIKFSKDSKIMVSGICHIGNNSSISMGERSLLEINALDSRKSNPQITLKADAILSLGERTRMACNTVIDCSQKIRIGGFGFISNNVTISDSNNSIICSDEDSLMVESISIGEHCLIGENVVIKRGTSICDEVIIEPHSIVKGVIPPRVKIAGTPATIIDNNVFWK